MIEQAGLWDGGAAAVCRQDVGVEVRRPLLFWARVPEEPVQWVRRERRTAHEHEPDAAIELPEDWSTEAGEALLRHGGVISWSVREWVRAVGSSFETRARSGEVRLAGEDIAQWRRQLEMLLLTQSAVVSLPEFPSGGQPDQAVRACAGLRLTRFLEPGGRLDCAALRQTLRLLLLVLLLARDHAGTRPAERPHISLLDLAALLMASGVPYDSENGRAIAAAVNALASADLMLHGQGWGAPPAEGERNRVHARSMADEAEQRLAELTRLSPTVARIVPIRKEAVPSSEGEEGMPELLRQLPELLELARAGWSEVARRARRNEMGRLLLVGASSAWMGGAMDCDSDEAGPMRALTEPERRASEGTRRRIRHVVTAGLDRLQYGTHQREAILHELEVGGGELAAAGLQAKHLAVFATGEGSDTLPRVSSTAEQRMRAALTLFAELPELAKQSDLGSVDGEKPEDAPAADSRLLQEHAALLAMRVAEDHGSAPEAMQPRPAMPDAPAGSGEAVGGSARTLVRWVLPSERQALTHSFRIAGREGTLTVGLFQDGRLGEVYLRMPLESSAVKGLLDAFSTATSIALQHGVTLRELTSHFAGLQFEPSGETANPEIPTAQSPMDYLFRWLAGRFDPLLAHP